MAANMKTMALIVAFFGILSFIFGVIAENKKPASGIPMPGKDSTICKYRSDPTVALGYLSVVFLVGSTVTGVFSLVYPYKGKVIPRSALFQSSSFVVFTIIAMFTAGLAAVLLLWPTVSEQLHIANNVHSDLKTKCPTAKTGLLGGGAFVALDASLFWLVALMLAANVREDYFGEAEKDTPKGENGSVSAY